MTYEYECKACGSRYTRQQRIIDAPNRVCIRCGKRKAQRLISGGGLGFALLGRGWPGQD